MNIIEKTGTILIVIIILLLAGGLVYSIDRGAKLVKERDELTTEVIQDSTLIYEKDSIIKDYANMNLKLRQVASEYPYIDRRLENDTSFTNISSKYN